VLQPDSSTLVCADTLVEYGILDPVASKILSVLLKEPSIALQPQIDRPRNVPIAEPHERAMVKRRSKAMLQPVLQVIIYGARRLFESIGTFIAECRYYLQQPHNCDRNVEYRNPHCLSPEDGHYIFTHDLKSSIWQDNPHANKLYLDRNPIDAFTDSSQCDSLPETKTPSSLKTRLYRYATFVHISRALYCIGLTIAFCSSRHQKQALTFMIRREEGWALGDDQQDIWRRSTYDTGRTR
jgi:SWI/SNF-related matrix-associated actin-dependent regulator of chromatin subfamily A3